MKTKSFLLNLKPFSFRINTNQKIVQENLNIIYGGLCQDYEGQIVDYDISITNPAGLRGFIKPQVTFKFDEFEPFKPLPVNHSFAICEWGMNQTVALNEMGYSIIHSAVLAKNNNAIIFPAPPGSGKSTLTVYLAFNKWRVLSDEMALMLPNSTTVVPFVRPICLKNDSIDLARKWFPEGAFSTIAKNTHKGDVAHISPPQLSWENNDQNATVRAIVFPKFSKGAQLKVYKLDKAQAFGALASNAFNFGVNGKEGFDTVTNLIESCEIFEITYSNLDEVIEFLEEDVLSC